MRVVLLRERLIFLHGAKKNIFAYISYYTIGKIRHGGN